jgi:hypothetical protein
MTALAPAGCAPARSTGCDRLLQDPAVLIVVGLGGFIAASHLEAAVGAFATSPAVSVVLAGLAVAAACWVVRLAARPSRAVLLAGACGAAALAALWICTRTLGLPGGIAPRAPAGILDTLTAFDELLLAATALAAARARRPGRGRRQRWPVAGSVAISLSFIALAMGCEPPPAPAGGGAPGGYAHGAPALICHLY